MPLTVYRRPSAISTPIAGICSRDVVHTAPGRRLLLTGGGAGTAAVGVEIVRLVQMSLAFYAVEIDELSELDAMVYDGYLEGLRDAGWHGDPRIVRLGYAAETGIFVWGGGGVRGTCAVLPDERRHAWLEQLLGRSMEEQVARDARHYRFRLALAGEARELMDSLS